MIITTQHLYTVPAWAGRTGFCARESRKWFSLMGLSWSDFVSNGIDSDTLLATGDAMAIRVVEHAQITDQANG